MSAVGFFAESRKRKSQELLVVLGGEPKCRVQKEWVSLQETPVLLSEWNLLVKTVLKSEQIQKLERDGVAQGTVQMNDGFRTSYQIFQSGDCFKAHFFFEPANVFESELSMPPVFLETVQRRQGLTLLAGPLHPYKTNTLAQTLYKLNRESSFHGAVFSKQAFPGIPEEKGSFVYQSTSMNEAAEAGFFAGADVVVVHETLNEAILNQALDLCDEGKMVLMTVASNSLMSALHKCLSYLVQPHNNHTLWRFAEHLKLAIAQYPLNSTTGETVLGFELILNSPQVKSWLAQGQVASIEHLLHAQQETAGVLSLNQSLLQLLIRRRIDIKQAFQMTHDPDGFDQLLKKVGI